MVVLSSKNYTVLTLLFYKYGGAIFVVAIFMSHFSMFIPTQYNLKLNNGNTRHSQGNGIILCIYQNCPIIYPVGLVYYFPVHTPNTRSLGSINTGYRPRRPLFSHYLIHSKKITTFKELSLYLSRISSKYFDGDINLVHATLGGIGYCRIHI